MQSIANGSIFVPCKICGNDEFMKNRKTVKTAQFQGITIIFILIKVDDTLFPWLLLSAKSTQM